MNSIRRSMIGGGQGVFLGDAHCTAAAACIWRDFIASLEEVYAEGHRPAIVGLKNAKLPRTDNINVSGATTM